MVFKAHPSLSSSQWHPCSVFRKHLLMNTFFLLLLTALFSAKFLLSANFLVYYFELLILMKTNEINSLIWWAFEMCSLLFIHVYSSQELMPRAKFPGIMDTLSQILLSFREDWLHWFPGATGTQDKLFSWHWPVQKSKVAKLSVGWQWFSVMLGISRGLCVLPRELSSERWWGKAVTGFVLEDKTGEFWEDILEDTLVCMSVYMSL